MKQTEVLAAIDRLVIVQRKAESMMLAAIVRAAELDVLKAAMDAAMSTTGLIIPTGMGSTHGQILGALWDALDAGEELTADHVGERATIYDEAGMETCGGYTADKVAEIWKLDPSARTAVDWGFEVARLDLEHWCLGQRVWPEALYRWFDYDDRLLYVGITRDVAGRQESHSKRSSWGRFADHCKIERYPTREDAEDMERHAIKCESPLFNHVHNDTQEARQRLVEYLVEKGRLDLLVPAVSRG